MISTSPPNLQEVPTVKASPADQRELLRLQSLDTRLNQLDHAARSIPALGGLAALTPETDALRRESTVLLGSVEDARAELGRAESDVAVVEARIRRDTDRLQQTSSVKDVQALEGELASLARRRGDLEDIELEVMERLEALDADTARLAARRDDASARTTALEAERDDALAAIDRDRDAVRADRVTIAGGIPDDLVALYEKQRARYGVGASELVGGVTSATGVALDGSDLDVVRRAAPDDVLLCPDSSAILIRPAV